MIDLTCPYCAGELMAIMEYNGTYHCDEYNGMECLLCMAEWGKDGIAIRDNEGNVS